MKPAYVECVDATHFRGEIQLHSFGVQVFKGRSEVAAGGAACRWQDVERTILIPWHQILVVKE